MANILIVDDSNLMRRNLKYLLGNAGHEVIGEASDGAEAYRQYTKLKPDLVTMDITMPNMNGIEAVKKILEFDPQANIVMISALDQKNMVMEAVRAGAKHYIIKPVTDEKIVQTVNQVLSELKGEAGTEAETVTEASVPAEASTIAKETPVFEMGNVEGWIVYSFGGEPDADTLAKIEQTLPSFFFMKPLRIAFRFAGATQLSKSVLQTIRGHAAVIEGQDGEVKIVCTEDELYRALVAAKTFNTIQAE
ncbi:response regulator [Paenibacillus turpanensis]|uniref:response regulator n=1 Tax=Paenibacillus turpanensis TaxID=2689078 RepID=UPI001408F512